MRYARVCGFDLYVPESIASWDAIAGDSPWELGRIHSILETLPQDPVLFDIGAEHGWMSAIFAQQLGGQNMVLVEPSPELWDNIRLTWDANFSYPPLACFQGFVSDDPDVHLSSDILQWPVSTAIRFERAGLIYKHLNHNRHEVWSSTIDDLASYLRVRPEGITIDVEGAELRVLKGAERVLREDRPYVWVSIHPDLLARDFGAVPGDIFQFMHDLEYQKMFLRQDHETHEVFWPAEKPAPSNGRPK